MRLPNPDEHRNILRGTSEWSVSRRAVLKTGGLASASSLPVFRAATGRATARGGVFRERAPVVDSEDPDPDTAIVVNVLDVPIRDWIVYDDETVADHNPSYDPNDRVVVVAFEHLLDSGWPRWRQENPNNLFDGIVDRGIKFHAFPQRRLDRTRPKDTGVFRERAPVVDSEDPDPDTAIVVNVLDVPIRDWIVYGNETVADHNPSYDPDDRVVVVAFEHLLDSGWPNWRKTDPKRLFAGVVSRGIKFHAFPQRRLDRARWNRA